MAKNLMAVNLPTFDLSYVVDQLSHQRDYANWSEARFEEAVREYRRFLALAKAHPNEPVIPGFVVDFIWHRHILNTRSYMTDCQEYFGYYFHHQPHTRVEAGTKTANDAWVRTLCYYQEMFGEQPPQGWLDGISICNGSEDSPMNTAVLAVTAVV